MKITVIIPTRNRADSLRLTLRSLLGQHHLPDEIIVVDSSDDNNDVHKEFTMTAIKWIQTPPSVCVQRNRGIQASSGDWIFLCDDDIELAPDYLEVLHKYLATHPDCGAVAGRLLQREGTAWVDQYPVNTFSELVWRFVFQLSIWGSIDSLRVPFLFRPIYYLIRKFYRGRRNTLTLAGWPLITNWEQPVFQTKVYSLGANLVRKDWLIDAPYDEILDPSGIGDNYGVALQFPDREAIHVVASTFAWHHRAAQNRLGKPLVYYKRLLALHYFILRFKPDAITNLWFIWSLIGNVVMFTVKGDRAMAQATRDAIARVITSRNPYWNASRQKN